MWIMLSAGVGAAGVVLGAFGAHALKEELDATQLATWNTAVEYQLVHAVALLAVVLHGNATGRSIQPAAALFATGILLFSGSLYGLSLGGPHVLGPVTPFGGLCFIAGWIALARLGSETD